MPRFTFPAYSSHTLRNGIRVFIIPDTSQDVAGISVCARYGAIHDTTDGVVGLMMSLLTKGTATKTATDIATAIDAMGTTFRIASGWESSRVSCTMLTEYFEPALRLMGDCILNASFADDEFERQRKQAISDHSFDLSDPGLRASCAFIDTMFAGHTYSHYRTGTVQSLQSLRREECIAAYEQYRSNSEWYIIVTGNVETNHAVQVLDDVFGLLPKSDFVQGRADAPQQRNGMASAFAHNDSSSQSVLMIGQRTIHPSHPDYAGVLLLNTMFGGYFLSRINTILREEKGYTYGAGSYIDTQRSKGCMIVTSASVGEQYTAESIGIILNEWKRLATEQVSDWELTRSSTYVTGTFARSIETPQQLAALFRDAYELGVTPDYHESILRQIAGMTPQALRRIQESHITPGNLVVAASGNRDILKPILLSYGNATEVIPA